MKGKRQPEKKFQLDPETCLVRMNDRGQILINQGLRRASGIKGGDLVLVVSDGPNCIRITKITNEKAMREIILKSAK